MSSTTTRTNPKEETSTRRIPPYQIVIENDPDHTFEFAVMVIIKVLRFDEKKAAVKATEVHEKERAIVWNGTKELAELKVDQVKTFRERSQKKDIGPLKCHMEPMSG